MILTLSLDRLKHPADSKPGKNGINGFAVDDIQAAIQELH